jgi:predicted lipoprotein with Yx(FWY)xxD motif
MRVRLLALGAGTSLWLALSACGSSSQSGTATTAPAQASQAGVTVGTTKTSLGTFLVGPDGRTLYLFEADTSPQSTCSGACAQTWPPLTTGGAPVAGGGAMQALLSTGLRSDGTKQVVYNGHPLYYYVSDAKAGDTTGEGVDSFGAGWDVVGPAGDKIEKAGS